MKELIKRILPKKWVEKHSTYKLKRRYTLHFKHDISRYHAYSGLWGCKRKEQLLARISLRSHVVEKGLTMPEMRFGFGKDNLLELIKLCLDYRVRFDCGNEILNKAVGLIREYKEVHVAENFLLEKDLEHSIDELLRMMPDVCATSQNVYEAGDYFMYSQSSFELFSRSRHSLRNFSSTKDVDMDVIYNAIELAQNAPSSPVAL